MKENLLKLAAATIATLIFSNCQSTTSLPAQRMVVSIADQRLVVFDQDGEPRKSYSVSTSKFGLGDQPGSNKTPLGTMVVRQKIGAGAEPGSVFKARQPTGEVVRPDSPGRDPIVSRILWLDGADGTTQNAYRRYIYIHGTAAESKIGQPVSYGCIRMRSKDVIALYESVGVGSQVHVKPDRLHDSELPRQDAKVV
jgi:lipoprotein-anchoring transpeptidase ErfK/SrfK